MKCITDTAANGNYIGTCTNVYPAGTDYYCSGVFNVDQFYDIKTNTQVATGPCAGSIASVNPAVRSPNDHPITGGTGAYKGATGTSVTTLITDSTKCPLAAASCYKIDFNLD